MSHALSQITSVTRRMFASRLAGMLNILVVGIALSLPAGMYMLLHNAQGLLEQFSTKPQLSLFLKLSTNAVDIDKLKEHLSADSRISRYDFVSRQQALEQLKQSAGLSEVITGLKQNPLPDAFIVYPESGDANALESLRKELAQMPTVELAQTDSEWAFKLEAILGFGRMAVLILSVLFSIALIAITFNTIRLQILTQREEIEVSRLIGATNGFIRRPFLYFGALQGLLGGAMALLIVDLATFLLNVKLAPLSQLYSSEFELHTLSAADSTALLLFSIYLGWLGAWLSVARHLSRG
jgi:cell division transport system permease protein